jgi:TPR repeat protein
MPDVDMDLASGVAAFEAKEFRRAMQLLSPLADNGRPEAQFRLAIMFQNGLGVVPNESLAFKWMRTAAEQGYGLAQHGLGFMYLEGECTEQNEAEAATWFRLAADQGLVGSMTTLAMMYEQGRGVERDPQKAKRLYDKAGFNV